MRLWLEGIDVDCVSGDRPDERVRTQRLLVDVELAMGDAAAETDDLADAVDYAELTERIRAALVEAKCRLIERAAKVVRDVCMTDPRVSAARVSVTKAGSVPHLGSATAILG